jgi:hypothetical protein
MRFHDAPNKGTVSEHQILYNIGTFLSRVTNGDESCIYGYNPGTKRQSSQQKSPNSLRPEKVRYVKSKVKSMLIIFFNNKGFVHKEFVQAGQAAIMFYGDCMKMSKDFTQNFGDKRTACCIMTIHHITLPFSPENF